MKSVFYAIIACCLLVFTACTPSTKKRLVGTWTFDKAMTQETYKGDKKSDPKYKAIDTMLEDTWIGGTLALNKDGSAKLSNNENSKDYTWKEDAEILELYEQSAKEPAIVFMPTSKHLFYMGDLNFISALMIFSGNNAGIYVSLKEKEE